MSFLIVKPQKLLKNWDFFKENVRLTYYKVCWDIPTFFLTNYNNTQILKINLIKAILSYLIYKSQYLNLNKLYKPVITCFMLIMINYTILVHFRKILCINGYPPPDPLNRPTVVYHLSLQEKELKRSLLYIHSFGSKRNLF